LYLKIELHESSSSGALYIANPKSKIILIRSIRHCLGQLGKLDQLEININPLKFQGDE